VNLRYVELDRAIPFLLNDLLRFGRVGGGRFIIARVQVGVKANLVAVLAAKQFVNRHAKRFAGDVVERVLDTGDGEDDGRIGRTAVAS